MFPQKRKWEMEKKDLEKNIKHHRKKDTRKRANKVKDRGGKTVRKVEDSVQEENSYPGSVSVTGKRSVVCCSHIQVLMQHLSHLPQLLVSVCLQVGG